jgi:hypothetical protein
MGRWITVPVPTNTQVLDTTAFSLIPARTGLIHTSLGPTFEVSSFLRWIEHGENYPISDADGVGPYRNEFLQHPKIILCDAVGAWNAQARERLTRKVLDKTEPVRTRTKTGTAQWPNTT